MPNFKPSILLNGKCRSYSTYRELKRHLIEAIQESETKEVTVSRSKRGEWGEYYEKWHMRGNQPKIFNQGWM